MYVTAEKTSQHSGTDATSSGVQSPDRVPRAHSIAGRQPSYAQPTVASLLRGSRSNDLLDGAVAVPICPRCRPRETEQLIAFSNTHTHTRLTALCPGLPGWAGTRKAKPISITEARDSEWQWHQLGHMQVCTSLQTDSHTSTPPLSFLQARMPFLPPNQQCRGTFT